MILQQHEAFSKWLRKQNTDVQTAVFMRLTRVADGNIGDSKSVGDGVFEMRIFHRPGYRIYYVMRGEEIIILLCAGDKSSQKSDIAKAKQLAKEV
jgi:putative addiction module killer protein